MTIAAAAVCCCVLSYYYGSMGAELMEINRWIKLLDDIEDGVPHGRLSLWRLRIVLLATVHREVHSRSFV